MEFQKLSSNSRDLLNEIVLAENPTELLCDKLNNASSKESEELRGMIRELEKKGYITVKWAANKPYHVYINNSARTYEEQLAEYNLQRQGSCIHNITIGNNNKIKNSTIGNSLKSSSNYEKKGFYERHPVICSILISLGAGIILLFPIWQKIISFIEGLF